MTVRIDLLDHEYGDSKPKLDHPKPNLDHPKPNLDHPNHFWGVKDSCSHPVAK